MSDILHLFSRDIVIAFLDTLKENRSKSFEYMAAVIMQRIYEKHWGPTLIGFYMNQQYDDLLHQMNQRGNKDQELLVAALKDGLEEYNQIDFVLYSVSQGHRQEFQLKRFGMIGGLITYLNGLKRKYGATDAACLIALTEIEKINLPKVRDIFEREGFPFTELLLIGVADDRYVVAGLLPEEGWGMYDLAFNLLPVPSP